MANELTGLPPHIQQLITQLLPPMEEEDPFEDLLAQLTGQRQQAEGAARDALGPLKALQGAPQPQTSPGTDAMTELLGGLSQMLAPELGGLEQARGARTGAEQSMQKQRATRLAQMEKNADELADRAKQLGNLELEMKWRTKAEGFKAKQQRDEERAGMATTLVRGEQSDQAAMERTRFSEGEATKRARIGADAALERVLARNPGLTRDASGEIVPAEGLADADFNKALVPMAAAYSNAKGSKKNDILPELKATFAQKKRSEAFSPTVYINRLRSANKDDGITILGKVIKGNTSRFSDQEIAHWTTTNYLNGDLTAPGNATKLMNMLQQAGYSADRAYKAVKQYQTALASQ